MLVNNFVEIWITKYCLKYIWYINIYYIHYKICTEENNIKWLCLIYCDASEIPEQTIKNIGKMLLVIDLAEYILKYHLEEPKNLGMQVFLFVFFFFNFAIWTCCME